MDCQKVCKMKVTIKEVIDHLESLAPRSSQEGYDNSGLIVGDKQEYVTGVLVCLDSIEKVVDEAIEKKCNLIIAHHPIIFKGLKTLTGKNYVERVVIKCIKNSIALYAIHTNLDNYRYGVNFEIGNRLGLNNLKTLSPSKGTLNKVSVFVPVSHIEEVVDAMHEAGAGKIGDYDHCNFKVEGVGSYRPQENSNPFIGEHGKVSHEKEAKVEMIVSKHFTSKVVEAMLNNHPYEEVAYDIHALENENNYEGAGMIGELKSPVKSEDFLKMVKETFNCGVIRHTDLIKSEIKTVAFCGGSGSFLLRHAIARKADVYITGDFKYHEFFDADNQIIIADIGHYESEQYTINLLANILTKKFPNFAVQLTGENTNPINYF